MTWSQFLFSPKGRINRARYWGALLLQYGIGIAFWLPVELLPDHHSGDDYSTGFIIYVVIALIATIALVISHVFTQIKRFHDRDKSWPWIFIQFIPYIGGIWLLVELGFLSGTVGRNRFGSDPLGRVGDIVDVFDGPTLHDTSLDEPRSDGSSALARPPMLDETPYRPAPTKT